MNFRKKMLDLLPNPYNQVFTTWCGIPHQIYIYIYIFSFSFSFFFFRFQLTLSLSLVLLLLSHSSSSLFPAGEWSSGRHDLNGRLANEAGRRDLNGRWLHLGIWRASCPTLSFSLSLVLLLLLSFRPDDGIWTAGDCISGFGEPAVLSSARTAGSRSAGRRTAESGPSPARTAGSWPAGRDLALSRQDSGLGVGSSKVENGGKKKKKNLTWHATSGCEKLVVSVAALILEMWFGHLL
jgi:hypothetical protein